MDTNAIQQSESHLAVEQEFIDNFFKQKVPKILAEVGGREICTPENCARFACKILGSDDLRPVDNQGAQSYTLISISQKKIVQFRLERFDEGALNLAHKVYGSLVPQQTLVEGFPLPVYVCPALPGHIHIFQQFPKDQFPLTRQMNTVRDLAQFIAKGAFHPQPHSAYLRTSWFATAGDTLRDLVQKEKLRQIDARFAVKAEELIPKLHLLEKLPPVLTHLDLAEVNLLVDPDSGHLTGVLDFDGARIEPFGICIFGIYEGFFGIMRDDKWQFFDQPAAEAAGKSVRRVLEAGFWDTLWNAVPSWMERSQYEEAITVALDIGIINRYFDWEGDVDIENEDQMRSINWAAGLLLDR